MHRALHCCPEYDQKKRLQFAAAADVESESALIFLKMPHAAKLPIDKSALTALFSCGAAGLRTKMTKAGRVLKIPVIGSLAKHEPPRAKNFRRPL